MGIELNCSHPLASAAGNVSTSVIRLLLLEEEHQAFLLKIPTLLILFVYVFLGIPGNILVILVYYFRFRASTTKTFIVSLATFDLASCVIGLPYEMVDLRYDMELDLVALCKILRFFVTLCACGATMILLCVAIDRFRRICQPFKRQMSVKQSKIVVVVMISLSLLIAAPALILYGSRTDVYRGVELVDCTIDDQWAKTLFANGYQFVLGTLWFASIVVLCIMYGIIIYSIRKQEMRRLNLTANSLASVNVSRFNNVASNGKRKISASNNDKDLKDLGENSVALGSQLQARSTGEQPGAIQDEKINVGGEGNGQRQNNSFNRMFSRDVNPIYEEEDEALKTSNARLCDVAECENDETVTEKEGFSPDQTDEEMDKVVKFSINFVAQENNHRESIRQKHKSENLISEADSEKTNNLPSKRRSSSVPCLRERLYPLTDDNGNLTGYKDTGQSGNSMEYTRSSSFPVSPETEVQSTLYCKDSNSNESNDQRSSSERHPLQNEETDFKMSPKEDEFCNDLRERNVSIFSGYSQSLEIPGKRYASEDKSLDQITSRSDQTNGSNLTLQDSRVRPDRQRTVSGRSSNIRPPSINSNNGSVQNDKRRSKANSISSQSSGKTYVTSVSNYRKQSTVSSRELKTSKIAVMMFHVTMIHVLSYLPHLAIQVHRVLGAQSLAHLLCSPVYFAFYHILLRSIYLNNAMNPIIYSYNNVQFRKYCAQLLTKPLAFCRRRSSNYTIDSAHSLTND